MRLTRSVTLTPDEAEDVLLALAARRDKSERFARSTKSATLREVSLAEADRARSLAEIIVKRGSQFGNA